MSVWKIAKWTEVFETAQSRDYKSLPWVSMPTDMHSNGYQALVDEFGTEALAVYGAWTAFVSVAAKCPVRGTLATSKGQPYSLTRIVREAYLHPDSLPVFEKLVAWASSEAIGWIVDATTESQSGDSQSSPDSQSVNPPPTKPNQTKHNPLASQSSRLADGVSYEEKVVTDELWEVVLPELQLTKTELFPEPPLSTDDRESLIRNVLVSRHYLDEETLECVRKDGKKLKRKSKLTNPMGYVCRCVSNACAKRGVDVRLASQSFCIPDKYLNPPKA